MGTLEFEGKKYTFDWLRILLLFVGAPILALGVWFSHDWVWLHGVTAKQTVWLLNLLTNGTSEVFFLEDYAEPWKIRIITKGGEALPYITFETLCTGIHAIAIFCGVIIFTPHTLEKETNNDIWVRKGIAALVTSGIFYGVNIIRMIIQLSLYRNGSEWEDIHYPISAASSFIAVACVLLMHKFVPEFIMSLIWIGDELKAKFTPPEDKMNEPLENEDSTEENEDQSTENVDVANDTSEEKPPDENTQEESNIEKKD